MTKVWIFYIFYLPPICIFYYSELLMQWLALFFLESILIYNKKRKCLSRKTKCETRVHIFLLHIFLHFDVIWICFRIFFARILDLCVYACNYDVCWYFVTFSNPQSSFSVFYDLCVCVCKWVSEYDSKLCFWLRFHLMNMLVFVTRTVSEQIAQHVWCLNYF